MPWRKAGVGKANPDRRVELTPAGVERGAYPTG
jgi:hypothetical protein